MTPDDARDHVNLWLAHAVRDENLHRIAAAAVTVQGADGRPAGKPNLERLLVQGTMRGLPPFYGNEEHRWSVSTWVVDFDNRELQGGSTLLWDGTHWHPGGFFHVSEFPRATISSV
jgi:hypothetical protein